MSECWTRACRVLAIVTCLGASPALAQQPATPETGTLPFAIGERLTYRVQSGKFGAVGRGSLSVEGPFDVRGTTTWLLRSEMHARVGLIPASERAESWIDPQRMVALRFRKRERRAFLGNGIDVDLFPDARQWTARDRTSESPTDAPLDELSFIYFVRTLPLDTDTAMRMVRHYDADRNPVEVRVVGRDSLTTQAGTFRVIVVEMRVKERGHYDGHGTIRLSLSDDARRLPVRIESQVPVLGETVLTLERLELRPAP